MGRFDGWLFVSDIDGTLVSSPSYTLSEENKAAIAEFRREGGQFTFATGRCLFGAMPLYRELRLNEPVIATNGSLIYDPVTDTFPRIFNVDERAALELYHYAKEQLDGFGFEIFNAREIYFIDDNPVVQHHIRVEHLPYPFVPLEEAKGPWCKIVFAINPPDMEQSREVIFSAPAAEHFFITQSADCYLELVEKSVSKGKAVLELAALLGIEKNRIITLGDNENDLSMFSVTPHSFAVKDGTDAAKRTAAGVVGKGGSSGAAVADVLKQIS